MAIMVEKKQASPVMQGFSNIWFHLINQHLIGMSYGNLQNQSERVVQCCLAKDMDNVKGEIGTNISINLPHNSFSSGKQGK